MDQRLLFV
ncbi:hypothetical protein BsWGS_15180 [Bradybaena similaris]